MTDINMKYEGEGHDLLVACMADLDDKLVGRDHGFVLNVLLSYLVRVLAATSKEDPRRASQLAAQFGMKLQQALRQHFAGGQRTDN